MVVLMTTAVFLHSMHGNISIYTLVEAHPMKY
jgi:hypothetical protein